MEVNKPFDIRVVCIDARLLEYINERLKYGAEIMPGLEFISFIETTKESIKPSSSPNTFVPTNKPTQKPYDGGWVNYDDKGAVQNMFNAFNL